MPADPMNILVTGGDGYIGSILVPRLLDAGHTVTALDTFAGNFGGLANVCANPRFLPVRGDVRDAELAGRTVEGQDLVIPLAALVGAPLRARDPWAASP